MEKIKISGTGCALVDYLYPNVNFNSRSFSEFQSKEDGDGGLCPGRLVFTEELEQFTRKDYQEVLSEITNGTAPSTYNLGGPGLVSLIHVAQMLPVNQFDVRFFGGAGRDDKAEIIFDLVKKTPLDISNYLKIGEKASPFTDVFSDPDFDNGNGERTFVNNIGAAWDYMPTYLENDFLDSDIVCFGGTALVPAIHDNLGNLLRKARQKYCISVVNTVFDFRNEKKNPGKNWPLGDTPEDLSLIDLLIMDKEEALKTSGCNSVMAAAGYFIDKHVTSFIITNGSQNLVAYSDGGIFTATGLLDLSVSARVLSELNSQTQKTGDTTGCGDNFAGGVIASIGQQLINSLKGQLNFIEAIAWGVASGGMACFYMGGTYFEKESFEKFKLVKEYVDHYLLQIETK